VISDDAGATFRPIGGALGGTYSGVFAGATSGSAFAVGGNGGFAKTSDGGGSWTRGSVPTAAALRALSFPSERVEHEHDRARPGGDLRGTTRFVAQWSGSLSAAGAGSRVLELTVGPQRRARVWRSGEPSPLRTSVRAPSRRAGRGGG
jgi:hypothetical protein